MVCAGEHSLNREKGESSRANNVSVDASVSQECKADHEGLAKHTDLCVWLLNRRLSKCSAPQLNATAGLWLLLSSSSLSIC